MASIRKAPIRRVTVEGASMAPALLAGDRLVVVARRRPQAGDIVAVPDPRQPSRVLVKRVTRVDAAGRSLFLEGDNRAVSTDSRAFGPVSRDAVIGRAVYRYFPPSRIGPLVQWRQGPPRKVESGP